MSRQHLIEGETPHGLGPGASQASFVACASAEQNKKRTEDLGVGGSDAPGPKESCPEESGINIDVLGSDAQDASTNQENKYKTDPQPKGEPM